MGEKKMDRKTFIALSAMQMRSDRNERDAVETAGKLADELERVGQAPWQSSGADVDPEGCLIREKDGSIRQASQ